MKAPRREMFFVYLLLGIGAVALALPFYYMLITSIKSMQEIGEPGLSMVVKHPTVEAYRSLLVEDPNQLVMRATWNSFVIGILSTGGAMLLCTMAGYAFAKHRFPGRDAIFMVLLSTMMIPGSVLLVPSFLLLRDFGWLDTWLPLIVPGLAGAFGVFLARQFIEKIPDSLIEAAKIEGAGEGHIFFRLIMPLSKPLLATLGIMTFLGSWNSFIGPLIVLVDEKKFTLPLVVTMLQGRFSGKDNIYMAGAMISILPVLVLFFIFQRQIVQSLASSGLKEG